MFELYFTGVKYCDQAKKFRRTGSYQMSKSRMTPGTSSMLRARRRDANIKPNRVLDKSASRGMIYENEDLRLRTMNINAEVEKGQHDIKKLRRENEQLRREIWTLREEYDRLESLLRKRQNSEEEAENSEQDEDEEDDDEDDNDENGPNEENTEEDGEGEEVEREIDKTKLNAKVEFDELSVVLEEPEDVSNEDERGSKSDNEMHYKVPNHPPTPVNVETYHHSQPRSDSLQKQNSIHPNLTDNQSDLGTTGAPSNSGLPAAKGAGFRRQIDVNVKHPVIIPPIHQPMDSNQPVLIPPVTSQQLLMNQSVTSQPVIVPSVSSQPLLISDVLVDDANVFQSLYERRAVMRHNIPRRTANVTKSDQEDAGGVTSRTSDSLHSSQGSIGTVGSSGGLHHSSSEASQECQLYVPPPQTLRLHCVQPFTVVFSVQDYEQLTVMDVIDILDEQLPSDVRSGLKGARMIEEQCYLSFSNQDQVNTVLRQGININGTHIQLQDASIGTAVIALTGVPHDVDDALVANILSSFGTILGSIERRMYKGVDTGERLIRLRPSSQIPSFIFIMGQRVTLRVLQPDEISCLRLRRRKSFRSQINLNIKLLDNDDILIEPVVLPSRSGSEYHTMPSLSKRQQRVNHVNPSFHSMPRMRQSTSPSGSQHASSKASHCEPSNVAHHSGSSSIPHRAESSQGAPDEPEYANIQLPVGHAPDVPGYDVPRTHTCKKIEINPAEEQKAGSEDHIEINVERMKDVVNNRTQAPCTSESKASDRILPHGVDQNRRPSLRLQMMKNSVNADNSSNNLTPGKTNSSATPATTQTSDDKANVFDFDRKSSIKFDRAAKNGSSKSSKIVHSPKISRKLSIYNPPDTPQTNGKCGEKGVPGSPQTSGNETATSQNEKKSPKRISKKNIKNIDGKPQDCSQSSSEGQESPTKHRKLLSMKGKKPVTRQPSGDQTDVPTSIADITTSERERSYSDSSSVMVTRRKMSTTGREGNGKVPWCGCWGNGCL
uniref:Uncharacterized protein n=1 Tax=Cacopsylla melanoneura TaxID=428564 RepID=A0A8D9DSK6_9HEMI